ncbi:MAG: hypothetical protein H5T86_15310 [Armatimonadetes bacterium]|nr:hypothetical protein [Armatimonadota bacterium]
MRSSPLFFAAVVALLGCTKSGGGPEALATAFVQAIQNGNYSKAAEMLDWDGIARQQNPDWDSFPASQRSLIAGKLKEQLQPQLQQLASRLHGATVTDVSVTGDVAQARAGGVVLSMKRTERGWKIASFQ